MNYKEGHTLGHSSGGEGVGAVSDGSLLAGRVSDQTKHSWYKQWGLSVCKVCLAVPTFLQIHQDVTKGAARV